MCQDSDDGEGQARVFATDDEAATPPPPEIISHILAVIQLLSIRATRASDPIRQELGIGSTEFRVLSVVSAEPECPGTRIADIIGRDEGAVSRSVTALIRKEMIKDVGDRGRARRLVLTDLGRDVQQRAWRSARERERRLMARFSMEEQRHLLETLQRLLKAMADEPRDGSDQGMPVPSAASFQAQ